MKVRTGDLWGGTAHPTYATVITTNGDVNRQHEAVMGRGVAEQAKRMFAELPRMLGKFLEVGGNHCYVLPIIRQPGAFTVSFPVKRHWNERADLKLIERSAHELVALANTYGWSRVYIPRPGCGNGRLKWEDVRVILRPIFDDRFVVCYDPRYDDARAASKKAAKVVVKKGAVSKTAQKRMEKAKK